jgi:hypothetical protein
MKNLRLDPFLYRDTCEEHGKNVPFIVKPMEVSEYEPSRDYKTGKVSFVFYCKKCSAWRGVYTIEEYDEYFGYTLLPDN